MPIGVVVRAAVTPAGTQACRVCIRHGILVAITVGLESLAYGRIDGDQLAGLGVVDRGVVPGVRPGQVPVRAGHGGLLAVGVIGVRRRGQLAARSALSDSAEDWCA